MNGWLVVNNFINDRKFNELYSWFLDASKENNIELSLKRTGDLISVLGEKPFNETPNFVLFWDKDIYLAQRLELMGMKVFNSAHAIEVCDNKALTAIQLSNNNIRIPKTIIAPKTFEGIGYNSTEFIEYAGENLKYPFIIKEVYGSFGQQVYLAETQQQAEIIIKKLDYKDFTMQELIKSSWGKDIRINIVENRAVASMYRYSTVGDFRSNITLGGQMETYQPNKEQIEIAIQACNAVGVDFGGVDILFGENDTPIVCEVNSNPHFKTTYECTKINIAKVIIEYIKGNVFKMLGWIIYTKTDAKKNEWFISKFQKYATKNGTDLELIYVEDLTFGVLGGKCFISHKKVECKLPDFVICRCIYPLLSKQFELMDIHVFNNYHVSSICNDKRKTHLYLAGNNIDMMDTLFLNRKYISNSNFSYPSIIKSIDGHGGNEVYYVRSKDEFLAVVEKLGSDEFLMQKVASNMGSDLRVYILGKNIVASVLRKSSHDFRSNYSLGGVPSLYNLSEDETKIVKKIISVFDFGFVGVDFVFDDGKIKLNEIEDVVGSRMLYQLTSIKSHEIYFDYIVRQGKGQVI